MKYVPGPMFGQFSGKAGNTVASRNKAGSYVRTRVIPKLVQNSTTSAVRGNFAVYAQRWRTITAAQRAGWRDLGQSIVRTNSIGATYSLTGLQAYESINRNIQTIGGTFLDDAPALTPPTALTTVTVTATSV